ncbi:MAG: hypothetical protein CVV57_04605 [Tenericutes bacterium HGW-Tenericutes-2]|jgi:hypothetical protein|nr:MAG: hypothetical protein CVV57_04605 [Tenericutes bacterium HGW-Tenericutes-2]
MKKLILITLFLILTLLSGCTSSTSYSSYSNWNVTDEDFTSLYKNEVELLITDLASNYNIVEVQQTSELDNDSFEIRYSINDFDIVFIFINDVSVAYFSAQLWHYEESFDNLFQFSKYENYLAFIDVVTNRLVFDYQGGIQSYRLIYDEKLEDYGKCCYFYHSDDLTGDIGYSIMWNHQLSSSDTRSVVIFKYRGLLRNQHNID